MGQVLASPQWGRKPSWDPVGHCEARQMRRGLTCALAVRDEDLKKLLMSWYYAGRAPFAWVYALLLSCADGRFYLRILHWIT